jgi:hypothetical protein
MEINLGAENDWIMRYMFYFILEQIG